MQGIKNTSSGGILIFNSLLCLTIFYWRDKTRTTRLDYNSKIGLNYFGYLV